jgi:hypothetical protein
MPGKDKIAKPRTQTTSQDNTLIYIYIAACGTIFMLIFQKTPSINSITIFSQLGFTI